MTFYYKKEYKKFHIPKSNSSIADINSMKEKMIIFDWGGVIESHRDNECNIRTAIINIMERLNVVENHVDLITKYVSCYNDEYSRDIGTYNKIEEVKNWFDRIEEAVNKFLIE